MRVLTLALVVFGLLLSAPAMAGDVDDLKATFENGVKQWNNQDEAWFAGFHDQSVSFMPTAPFAVNGNAQNKTNMKRYWNGIETAVFRPLNTQYRVFGSTGIIWGHYALPAKPKDGPAHTSFGRFTLVCSKMDGKWRMVSSHYSAMPTGN
jgi:ketosteroid isomerase-like protein